MRILAFAASLRSGSLNRRLIELAAAHARDAGAEVDLADFREFDMPSYDSDVEHERGCPPGGEALKRRLAASEGLMLALPEYNYSMPGAFKNAVDWVSRARPMPWRGRSIYLMSASPSPMGGIRGLWQARVPLEGCGALVFPDMFALPHAHQAFGEGGALTDPALSERLKKEVIGFVRLTEAVAPILLGARPQPRKEIVEALEDESALQPPTQ